MFTHAEGGNPTIRPDTTKEESMPQIIVIADRGAAFGEGAVTLRERVNVADFDSAHFASQLLERLGWAVGDADEVERVGGPIDDPADPVTDPDEPAADPAEPTTDASARISVRSPA
jgi:hypothetical protein